MIGWLKRKVAERELARLFRRAGEDVMGNLKAAGKTGAFGGAAVIVSAVIAKFSEACPDLVTVWPQLLAAGVMAGVGLWMRSPKTDPPRAEPKEPRQ